MTIPSLGRLGCQQVFWQQEVWQSHLRPKHKLEEPPHSSGWHVMPRGSLS